MKAVLMSIQPKFCELIASGKKTVEVRKTKPKLEVPFKVYIYCTKGKPILGRSLKDDSLKETPESDFDNYNRDTLFRANGKVIGEFVCDRVDEYRYGVYDGEFCYHIPTVEGEKTCLEYDEAEEYGNGKPLYFWHITDLVIYDKPRELSYFFKPRTAEELEADVVVSVLTCGIHESPFAIKKPPQSWCYVEEGKRWINRRSMHRRAAL